MKVDSLMKRHSFLMLGIATFGLLVTIGIASDAVKASGLGHAAIDALRVLSIPLWLMRDLEMLVGMGSWPGPLQLVVALPILFAPYFLADYLLQRARSALSKRPRPSSVHQ